MVLFWEPLSMGSSSSIIFFKSFSVSISLYISFYFNFPASMRVSLLDVRPEVKAIKLSEPFSLFGLIFVLFLKSRSMGPTPKNRPMDQAHGLLVLRRLTRRRHLRVGADV